MAQHFFNCQVCREPFEATRADARQCSKACAQSAFRARQDVANTRNRAAADLLRRQTRAIIDGADPVVLAAIAREADELFAQAV